MKYFSIQHQQVSEELFIKIKNFYQKRLLSLVVYGSYARNTPRLNSDLDLLIILEKNSKSSLKLQREFVRSIEMPMESSLEALEKQGITMEISTMILSQNKAQCFLPIYLDMVEYAEIIYDRNSFMKERLLKVGQQMQAWGSQKKFIGGHYYWEIRPGLRWNEVMDYDK